MSNIESVRPVNLPAAPTTSNPWLDAAAKASTGIGKLLKFAKGHYETGDDEIKLGTELIAHVDQIAHGWVKFVDGKLVDQHIVKIADRRPLPERDGLGDLDQSKWEPDAKGERRDCWVLQWYLPLSDMANCDLLTFITASHGGVSAIGKLCSIYGRRGGTGPLPVIELGVRSYKHKTYGRIETPEFSVVGWDDNGGPSLSVADNSHANETNDSIPF
jgi:hypothetical protein